MNRFVRQAQDRLREVDYLEERQKWRHHEKALDALLVRARRLSVATGKLGAQLRDLLCETGNGRLLLRQNRFEIADFTPNRLRRPRLKRKPG